MSAVGLVGIKRRIKSVNNTKKITNAMGLVATSKLRKAREALIRNKSYYDCLEEIKIQILNSVDNSSIYLRENNSGKKLYLVITSDLGLCGSYNLNVISETLRNINKKDKDGIVFLLGQKGRNYLKKYGINPDKEIVDVSEVPDMEMIHDISKYIFQQYENGKIDSVDVIYTNFTSTVKQEVKLQRILPLEKNKSGYHSDNFTFEPESNYMLEEIVELYINEKLLNYILNSKACENAARMNAMNGATKNANDLLDKLNTKYNRIRQSSITEEISEIVGGAEAQK